MTIQVVSTEGFNPSLTGIHPYETSSHNFEVVATGGVSASQNREIAVNFPVDFDKFYEDWRMATIQAKLLQPAIDDAKKNVEA